MEEVQLGLKTAGQRGCVTRRAEGAPGKVNRQKDARQFEQSLPPVHGSCCMAGTKLRPYGFNTLRCSNGFRVGDFREDRGKSLSSGWMLHRFLRRVHVTVALACRCGRLV